MDKERMPETLQGLIERVTYHNPENGFAVLKVKVVVLPGNIIRGE